MFLNLIAWLVLGLTAGFIASKMVNRRGEGIPMDIILGIVGALVGGFFFNLIGGAGVTGFNLWSLFVAIMGSVGLLLAWHAIRGPASSV